MRPAQVKDAPERSSHSVQEVHYEFGTGGSPVTIRTFRYLERSPCALAAWPALGKQIRPRASDFCLPNR